MSHHSSDAYLDTRNRFMDVYRRDKLNDTSSNLTRSIEKGNLKTHGGDCGVDASLFGVDKRSDFELFMEIYEVSVKNVLLLCKCDK